MSSGLSVKRYFTHPDVHPLDSAEWEQRDAAIYDKKGKAIFQQVDIEVPKNWSRTATDIMASKYLRKAGVPVTDKETSARQLISRVAGPITRAGEKIGGYFSTPEDATTFEMELTYLLLAQRGTFNSPVWFNSGLFASYGITGEGGNFFWNANTGRAEATENAYERPQNSACFIQSVNDSLESMLDLQKAEVRLFKYGSGTGSNFSKIRSLGESLQGGGESSGVLSFLEGFDRWAGSIKSGGTTRRAAKMVLLDMDHPEIVKYINWKANEEKKALALIAAGYPADFNGEAYHTVSGQNSNNSVRIPKAFMDAFLNNGKWQTTYRTTGEVANEYDAKWLMDQIAEAAWACADPGVQFDDTIHRWHTCKNTDQVFATNPCSEFVFLDDTACNLASINLVKFLRDDGTFDIEGYRHAIRIFIIAMDLIVESSSYPTPAIAERSYKFRPLGLGFANLGSLLMSIGIPYDSDEARGWAASLAAILSGHGYSTSAQLASSIGAFDGFSENRDPMLDVMELHKNASRKIDPDTCPSDLVCAAQEDWDICLDVGGEFGYRNAQISVIAPTGTTGIMMDCDTLGIEPDFALVKFKKLAGGGYFKIENQSISVALKGLGYPPQQIKEIVDFVAGTSILDSSDHINPTTLKAKGLDDEDIISVERMLKIAFDIELAFAPGILGDQCLNRLGISATEAKKSGFSVLEFLGFTREEIDIASNVICGKGTVEGAPHLSPDHYGIFDCASKCGTGSRFIASMGHVKMVAAVQLFISGAISKTVNLPNEATVDDIRNVYVEAWKRGVKCLAVYRDGSKGSQPLSTTSQTEKKEETQVEYRPVRKKLSDTADSIRHKFEIAGHEGYVHVGLYADGTPGEVFIRMNKEGSTISGLMDTIATKTSLLLQHGVTLDLLVDKFSHVRFEPSGFTSNKEIPIAKSIIDYIFRWLGLKFLSPAAAALLGLGDGDNGSLDSQLAKPADLHPITGLSDSNPVAVVALPDQATRERQIRVAQMQTDAPPCLTCGSIMIRNGTCYRCLNCGATSGCS